ncbi:MAG: acetyl-CoA carboxylase biotin carboxylase subunit [Pseudomonadota bacterium]
MQRVFVANRGEIALRVNRAAHALGLETVQAVSAADQHSMAAEVADRSVVIGPAQSKQSYLDPKLIVHAAKLTGCDALHPGYGFLSERAELAALCVEHDINFVGPNSETIHALGDKLQARKLAAEAGVPLVPGTDQIADSKAALVAAKELGFPVVMKASAGGGGRGMFVAREPSDIEDSFDKASAEALEAFGDGTLYIERYVENARHVEVQVLGDGCGKVVHFGERDCSVQRRYQKVFEESPCVAMPDATRDKLHAAAVKLVATMNYRNAGTVEFIYDVARDEFYFIEVNARIQVEHPVTEQVTGFDLVQWQLRIAQGEPLDLEQHNITVARHAIECRINAEDPHNNFLPSPGRLSAWHPPSGAGIRIDSHCRAGYLIPPYYDSMIGKLIVTAGDREATVERLVSALNAFQIDGIKTNLPLLKFVANSDAFKQNNIDTRWLEREGLPDFETNAA